MSANRSTQEGETSRDFGDAVYRLLMYWVDWWKGGDGDGIVFRSVRVLFADEVVTLESFECACGGSYICGALVGKYNTCPEVGNSLQIKPAGPCPDGR